MSQVRHVPWGPRDKPCAVSTSRVERFCALNSMRKTAQQGASRHAHTSHVATYKARIVKFFLAVIKFFLAVFTANAHTAT